MSRWHPIIQEGLEGFAPGRFQLQTEVRRFFESQPAFPNTKGNVRNELVRQILTKPIYAGYVDAPEGWNVPLGKGRHEGLIDFSTFERIQERIKDGAKVPARPDISAEFPLRGSVACGCCSRPMTSCWSKSKTGTRHPYYYCVTKGCERRGKSIRRDKLEREFVALLDTLTPAPTLFSLVRDMFKDAWNQRAAQAQAIAQSYEREIGKVEQQISTLVERILKATNDAVIAAYENHITALERNKLVLEEKQGLSGLSKGTEELFELAFTFLASPSKLWSFGRIEHQKLVLKLAFADRL